MDDVVRLLGLSSATRPADFSLPLTPHCNTMYSVFIDGLGGGWCGLKPLLWFHQRSFQTASKESKSNNKCIIEFKSNTWMKYLFFDSSCKKSVRACAHVCVCACTNGNLVGAWYEFTHYASRYRSLTPGHPAASQIDSITLSFSSALHISRPHNGRSRLQHRLHRWALKWNAYIKKDLSSALCETTINEATQNK